MKTPRHASSKWTTPMLMLIRLKRRPSSVPRGVASYNFFNTSNGSVGKVSAMGEWKISPPKNKVEKEKVLLALWISYLHHHLLHQALVLEGKGPFSYPSKALQHNWVTSERVQRPSANEEVCETQDLRILKENLCQWHLLWCLRRYHRILKL